MPYLTNSLQQTSNEIGQGSRPGYIYDRANIINEVDEILLDDYARMVDDVTTAEIVVYTIPDFVGHGIRKDGQEIQDRDMLANYIFNEVPLEGTKGIGKEGLDNGVLLLLSLNRDAGGGSIRLEIGRGLEGNITDGTAGQILDAYLVPARAHYEESGDISAFSGAIYDTVITIGELVGYSTDDSIYEPSQRIDFSESSYDARQDFIDNQNLFLYVVIFIIIVAVIAAIAYRKRGASVGGGSTWISSGGGGYGGGGGGSGGGGGGSGGGGAGR
jgi:uncharacterized protein